MTRKTVAQNTKLYGVWWSITRATVVHNTYQVFHKTKAVAHSTKKNIEVVHNTSYQERVLFGRPVEIINEVR